MLRVCEKPKQYNCMTLHNNFSVYECNTLKEKIGRTIEVLKTLPINGCITGSCLLPVFEPDEWGSTPDVDVFVYGETELVRAVTIAQYALDMTPGSGSQRSKEQEEWKLNRLFENGVNYKIGITTYKFFCDGVSVNFTFKQMKNHGHWVPIISAPEVLRSFDMSILMLGFDIKQHVFYDMRGEDVFVARPNPLRNQDCVMWTVQKWIRQFDRVVKYYGRGYDTRPMAEFYLKMIDQCIEVGCLFDSTESNELFESMSKEFLEKRAVIADWYDEHKED